jgi:hypothetical protein
VTSLFITYENAIKKYGEPQEGESISPDHIDTYRSHLPDTLLEFWKIYGIGKWMNGYFQFCQPTKYIPIIDMIFDGDKDFNPHKTHAIGFSAFGGILAWNEQHGVMNIDPLDLRVSCGQLFKPAPEKTPGSRLGIAVQSVDEDVYDKADENGKPMFKRALKAYGELGFGQIYAPKLHPALGGTITVDNFRPADALVAMSIGVQTGTFTLYNTTIPSVPAVRTIGE